MATSQSKRTDSRKQQPTLEDLPDGVLCNIFMRLPAKLLAQMKSLCNPWNALLSQPYFIKSHLHHSIHNKHEVLLVTCRFEPQELILISSPSPHIDLDHFITPPAFVTNRHVPDTVDVIGSVNGLVGFCTYTRGEVSIHIWNPSLSANITLFTIPPSDDCNIVWRFGFDPKNDDYKVVKATFYELANGDMDTKSLHVEVYSIRKGSWESITVRFPSRIKFISTRCHITVDGQDGRLHWICYAGSGWEEDTIVAFDLGVETCTEISLPESIRFVRSNVVGVLSQKLCVVSCVEGEYCDVWVMDTYGLAKSWVKRYVFKQRSIIPLGFTSSNKFLFAFRDDDDLALYDPNTNEVKFFKIGRLTSLIEQVPYVDSLVWPFG